MSHIRSDEKKSANGFGQLANSLNFCFPMDCFLRKKSESIIYIYMIHQHIHTSISISISPSPPASPAKSPPPWPASLKKAPAPPTRTAWPPLRRADLLRGPGGYVFARLHSVGVPSLGGNHGRVFEVETPFHGFHMGWCLNFKDHICITCMYIYDIYIYIRGKPYY